MSLSKIVFTAMLVLSSQITLATDDPLNLKVYKTETCGCCKGWVKHIEQQGFGAEPVDMSHSQLTELKQSKGINRDMRSCHTAVYKGQFVFEGHVPAKFIEMFINNPPSGAIGLSVPRMPVGTPGMEVGDRFQPYAVMQMNEDGTSVEYAKVTSYQEQF